MNKFLAGLYSAVQFGCIIGITGIALKRNKDCYDAECRLHEERMDHLSTQLEMINKDYEIKVLKKELEKVKSQGGEA